MCSRISVALLYFVTVREWAEFGGALAGHRPDFPAARKHRRGPPLSGIQPAERENRRHGV